MKAILLLADAAQQDANGKVHALGVGWAVTSTPTPPIALIVVVDCEWSETNIKHTISVELVDADGQPVLVGHTPQGEPTPLTVEAELEVGRPAGLPPGTAIRNHLVINFAPGMPLDPGQKYTFRLTVDGEPQDSWASTFYVQST